ncbi:unnamed protein product, partial [marine sediment metagenome]
DAALPRAEAAGREHLLYHRGLALLYDGRPAEALGQFAKQLDQFPEGSWAGKARFRKADVLLSVLPRGARSPDEYHLTPDELYQLGKLHFDDEQYAPAAEHLEALLAGKWLLNDEPYRESVRMLLGAALVRDDAAAIVNYFEILKERYPELVVPFEQIIRVADAYARTGQHERAYLVYRATADASFVRDSAVGGTLQDEGRFLESIDFLEDLWRAYPDTPQVENTYYALAQTLAAQAQDPSAVRPRRAAAADGQKYVTHQE